MSMRFRSVINLEKDKNFGDHLAFFWPSINKTIYKPINWHVRLASQHTVSNFQQLEMSNFKHLKNVLKHELLIWL